MIGTEPGILKADAFNILPVPFLLQLYLFHRQCVCVGGAGKSTQIICVRLAWKMHWL